MIEGYLGTIMLWPHSRIPDGWVICDGRVLNIAQNQALFALLSNRYGGDGRSTFALPDLRGRAVVCANSNRPLGVVRGAESVTLTKEQLPTHTHTLVGVNTTNNPVARVASDVCLGSGDATNPVNLYNNGAQSLMALNSQSISPTGGGQAHNNMQPYIVLNYIICIRGYFPPRP